MNNQTDLSHFPNKHPTVTVDTSSLEPLPKAHFGAVGAVLGFPESSSPYVKK